MDSRPIDLHVHSSYSSDGEVPPARLVEMAAELGLAAVALADHDTVDGLDELAEAGTRSGVETVPGVELTVDHGGGYLHILGYFIRHGSGRITELINRLTGVPVLAHPGEQFSLPEDRDDIIRVIDAGIAGLEVYCSYHDAADEGAFGGLADELGLVKTAGSDYHGSPVKPHIKMGQISYNPYSLLTDLRERLGLGR
jgi:predicted metal-dependent phosphoesterase TrpH